MRLLSETSGYDVSSRWVEKGANRYARPDAREGVTSLLDVALMKWKRSVHPAAAEAYPGERFFPVDLAAVADLGVAVAICDDERSRLSFMGLVRNFLNACPPRLCCSAREARLSGELFWALSVMGCCGGELAGPSGGLWRAALSSAEPPGRDVLVKLYEARVLGLAQGLEPEALPVGDARAKVGEAVHGHKEEVLAVRLQRRSSPFLDCISESLSRLGIEHHRNAPFADTDDLELFCLDVAIPSLAVAVEFAHTSDFLVDASNKGKRGRESGPVMARRRLAEASGWHVLVVSYKEFNRLYDTDGFDDFFRRTLN
ncbi:hypothetical protein TeGR_g11023 [Tetraparma gracilis]|uniref:Uncharacterized protein n=1 Tax=Tetraparma gracilis TaxID=2962635 RepID=A0ABQ6MJU8_9STRA|nr:hypothetical protein TeGR_g11023 [Tetraparma gracilis]